MHAGDPKGAWEVAATAESNLAPCWSVLYLKRTERNSGSISALKKLFPDGQANEMSFVLFSTSGVHGWYTTLEEVEASIEKYGDYHLDETDFPDGELPEDYTRPEITFVVIQPRIVGIRYGNVRVRKADIPYLKKLRQSSWDVVASIGRDDTK